MSACGLYFIQYTSCAHVQSSRRVHDIWFLSENEYFIVCIVHEFLVMADRFVRNILISFAKHMLIYR